MIDEAGINRNISHFRKRIIEWKGYPDIIWAMHRSLSRELKKLADLKSKPMTASTEDKTDQVEIDYPGLLDGVCEFSIEADEGIINIDNNKCYLEVTERDKHGQVLECIVYLPNDDTFTFESTGCNGTQVNSYDKEQAPKAKDKDVILSPWVMGLNHVRMLNNDLIPVMMKNKVVKVPEFNSKCCICSMPCNKKGKISICDGGCK